jgi:predicted RNase H-like HicB family nuclease
MAKLAYSVIIDRAPDGRFRARVPALPEAETYGASVEAAFAGVATAIESALAARKQRGKAIPPPDFS